MGKFPAVFVATKVGVFDENPGHVLTQAMFV